MEDVEQTPGKPRKGRRDLVGWLRGLLKVRGPLRRTLVRSLLGALEHDSLNLAQSTAYSALVALFPALIVSAAAIAVLPDATPIKAQLGAFFDEILPAEVLPLLRSYFVSSPKSPHTARALVLAVLVSLSGASSVLATLMEGLRRAANLPTDCWTFWQRRARALALVPLSLMPLMVATILVIFGQAITVRSGGYLSTTVRPVFYGAALVVRWTVALAGVAGLTALIYHMGTPKRQSWLRTLPGAVLATLMWFVATLIFGWYVTRFANYSQVYGSLGVGVALLFWLYLVFLSVLFGAEFNEQVYQHFSPEASSRVETRDAVQAAAAPNAIG